MKKFLKCIFLALGIAAMSTSGMELLAAPATAQQAKKGTKKSAGKTTGAPAKDISERVACRTFRGTVSGNGMTGELEVIFGDYGECTMCTVTPYGETNCDECTYKLTEKAGKVTLKIISSPNDYVLLTGTINRLSGNYHGVKMTLAPIVPIQ